ncbi:hypothetical protein FHL15_006140 [Xylaria flabelliformis]|uniref:Zn(2)-C6 fungal-type domain-containing protein n=1 Tax=Xylaria flabelliformis TaxID=2512241 RepID=A0A553HYI9_9PEZI|nr:hypothetical protein FHL15_006140 [Xylaria flabelliformis]
MTLTFNLLLDQADQSKAGRNCLTRRRRIAARWEPVEANPVPIASSQIRVCLIDNTYSCLAASIPVMAAQPSTSVSPSSLEQSETLTRTSAPYGQACLNCAKAKCKCILISQPSSGSGRGSRPICERCARLGRECKPSSSIRKRGAAVSRRTAGGSAPAGLANGMSAASRAANLEQKLEDLVAILQAQASTKSNGDESARTETGATPSSVADRRSNNVASGIVAGGPTVVTPASTAYATCSTVNSTPSPAPALDVLTSAAEAEETLAFFRLHHLQFFPFVYIPPEMTAAQLSRDRPYLWLVIRAVCCRSPVKQAALSRQIREELAHRILVSCERTIDMLLGALCLLGWTMHLCFKPAMSAVMSIATSIVTDLRFDKPAQEDDPPTPVKYPALMYSFPSGGAFLKGPSMRWTPHMEASLKILASDPEWEGDQILVLMVRIQRLADSIIQAQATWASDCDSYATSKPPAGIYVKYFNQCLQTIKGQVPETLKDNRLATSLIMYAEMVISEIPFINSTCWGHLPETHVDAQTRQLRVQPPSQYIDIARVEANYATLQTSKAFFEHFLTFELPDFVGFSFPVLLNFFRAAQILYRLRVADGIGSDNSAATDGINLLEGIELAARRYEQLPRLYGFLTEVDADGNDASNFYDKCAKTFHSTLPMWRAHFAQAEAARMGAGTGTSTGTDLNANADSGVSGPQVSPAMPMNAGFNSNIGGRVNYPGMNNFMLPDLFPMDFSMDDAWCNELMFSFDPSLLGPVQ